MTASDRRGAARPFFRLFVCVRCALALAGLSLVDAETPSSARAQTAASPVAPGVTQQTAPVTVSPVPTIAAPTSGISARIITPSTTNQLEPGIGRPSPSGTFAGAGRGLPGMPGGPPVNGPVGAQDRSAAYMRPPVIGPLLCDPAVDLAC